MIVWPGSTSTLNTFGQSGLNAFRASAGAAELESSKQTWRVVSWPWTGESPMRIGLENEQHHQVIFSMAETGIWRFSDNPMATRERSSVALEEEARGEPGERTLQPGTRI